MTAREKSLWLRAGALLVLIYSTLYLVRGPIEFLRDRNLLRLTVAVIFLVTAVWLVAAVRRRRPGRREIAVLALFAVPLVWFLLLMERPEERLHLLEYGLLGALVYAALLERTGHRQTGAEGSPRPVALWVPLAAIVITSLAGWLDEGIQHLLPNRYYDLKDVGYNALGGLIAVGAMYAAGVARRADRARG